MTPIVFEVEADGGAAVGTWLALLAQWNARIDLTAARSDDELRDLMLTDAAVLATARGEAGPILPSGASVVDVGTGAGAPGLALALFRTDLRVTLVEPLAKRAAFLRTVIGSIGRTDIALLGARGEDVARAGSRFDVAISRATLPPRGWVPLGLELAGNAWTLLAKDEPPAVANAMIDVDVTYAWPRTGATRRAVRYVRAE